MQWVVLLVLCIGGSLGRLWKNGVVHFSINQKDYDVHSQDIILSAFKEIQNDICVKFFNVPQYSNNSNERILYINNPEKVKNCPPDVYDYSKNVLDMIIGYKCLNQKDIARMVVEMLRASIDSKETIINSFDLIKKFQESETNNGSNYLISQIDRNYINAHYNEECMSLNMRVAPPKRRSDGGEESLSSLQLSQENVAYYNDKVWPLAVVLYGVDEDLRGSPDFEALEYAMMMIQLETCIVFQEVTDDTIIKPKTMIWFGVEGNDVPLLGRATEIEKVNLTSMVHGAPGHTGHLYNNLMRILGVGMMSNRFDRDNYIVVNWKNIKEGYEHYFEKLPEEAWLVQIPYDFDSITHAPANYMCATCNLGETTVQPIQVRFCYEHYFEKLPEEAWLVQIPYDFDSITHAPANYMCATCNLGETTVQPIQDHLWQRIMAMGHKKELSNSDVKLLNILYSKQCKNRYMADDK